MINEVPTETGLITPPRATIEGLLTVAIPVLALDHTPPAVASANCVVDPTHTVAVPVIANIAGKAFTVTVLVALTAGDPFVVNFKMTVPL